MSIYIGSTLCMQLLLQFYTTLFETLHVFMSWTEDVNVLRVSFYSILRSFFLLCELSHLTYSFHDSPYIKRQTLTGGGHNFSEFACLFLVLVTYAQ